MQQSIAAACVETTANNAVIAERMACSYLEVVPAPGMADCLAVLPDQAYVAITCSPTKGVEPTLDLMEQLAHRRLRLVPHIAARMVRDSGHLREILQRLKSARIESVFIPGGDAPEPLGIYRCALDLLHAIAESGYKIEDIGVATYPEGHPRASDATLLQALLDKQAYATYLVTQMCFDSEVIVRWLRLIRTAGVHLPAWIGLPGVADYSRLFKLSMRIGVGQSARVLLRQKGLLKKLIGFKPYQPDKLLKGLLPCLGDPSIDVPGFHLFSFNDIERTERWRCTTLRRYQHAA